MLSKALLDSQPYKAVCDYLPCNWYAVLAVKFMTKKCSLLRRIKSKKFHMAISMMANLLRGICIVSGQSWDHSGNKKDLSVTD